jgi:uncharacterized protein Smg (DUF494 family)
MNRNKIVEAFVREMVKIIVDEHNLDDLKAVVLMLEDIGLSLSPLVETQFTGVSAGNA